MNAGVNQWLENLRVHQKLLTESEVRKICYLVKQIIIEECNVPQVRAPCIVVGDLHGQFYDFLELLSRGGDVSTSTYVFLGDFVDRGHYSVETISLLVVLKVRYPRNIVLLRGNHESRQVTQVYGFYDEVVKKYGNSNVWKYFTDLFDYLPLAALIDDSVFCVHGGLSPFLPTLDQIRCLQRVQEIPTGPYGDLLWSDPEDNIEDWEVNMRGAGWLFGRNPTEEFLYLNSLSLVTRAHQFVEGIICQRLYSLHHVSHPNSTLIKIRKP